MAANILTFFIIENKRVGRWGLLMTGVTTMTVCMLGIALVETISKGNVSKAGGSMYVVFLAIFSAASSLGPGVAGQSAFILSLLGLPSELLTTRVSTGLLQDGPTLERVVPLVFEPRRPRWVRSETPSSDSS